LVVVARCSLSDAAMIAGSTSAIVKKTKQ
jgi:hypothetical protein